MSETVHSPAPTAGRRIRWGRIAAGAILLEAVLLALAVPVLAVVDNPFAAGEGASGDFTFFFITIAAACFLVGGLAGWWVARPLSSSLAIHGAWTGIVATAIYLAICSIPPTTIPAVVAAYGPFWFFTANGLRILGATLGAASRAGR